MIYNALVFTVREGNGSPLQYCCLANPMDGGAWWAAVHGVAKSRTQLSDFPLTLHFHALEKEMATPTVFLPGESQARGSLVGCRPWGRTGSDTTEATQQQQERSLLCRTVTCACATYMRTRVLFRVRFHYGLSQDVGCSPRCCEYKQSCVSSKDCLSIQWIIACIR